MKQLLGLAVAAVVLSCRNPDPRASLTAGRGAVGDTSAISVRHVAIAPATVDYAGKEVRAGPDHRYVLIDCQIAVAPDSLDFNDFQLVQDRAAQLGHEINIGDHGDRDYFYWSYLDESESPVMEPPGTTGPFMARLAFKVPASARKGYLFYWGLYWGPFEF